MGSGPTPLSCFPAQPFVLRASASLVHLITRGAGMARFGAQKDATTKSWPSELAIQWEMQEQPHLVHLLSRMWHSCVILLKTLSSPGFWVPSIYFLHNHELICWFLILSSVPKCWWLSGIFPSRFQRDLILGDLIRFHDVEYQPYSMTLMMILMITWHFSLRL